MTLIRPQLSERGSSEVIRRKRLTALLIAVVVGLASYAGIASAAETRIYFNGYDIPHPDTGNPLCGVTVEVHKGTYSAGKYAIGHIVANPFCTGASVKLRWRTGGSNHQKYVFDSDSWGANESYNLYAPSATVTPTIDTLHYGQFWARSKFYDEWWDWFTCNCSL